MPTIDNALENLEQLDLALRADVEHWRKKVQDDKSGQIERRALVRSMFAMIEGINYGLKHLALETAAIDKLELDANSIAMIREEVPDLTDAGEVQTRRASLPFRSNLKFSFKIFSEVLKAGYILDTAGDGWLALLKSVKVRDRLMHPKVASDTNILDTELADALIACGWFESCFAKLFEAATCVREASLVQIQENLKRLQDENAQLKVSERGDR